jgi:hypothetical protein
VGRADEYRRRAQQCLEMAAEFRDRDARRSLSHMAEVWLRLAERNDFMPRATQPVVQQQHQVPPKQGQRGLRGTHEKIVSDFALFWRSRIRVRYRARGCYLAHLDITVPAA